MWWVLTAATAGVPGEHSSSAAIRAETKFLPMPLSPEDLSTLRPGSRCIDEVVDHWMLLLQVSSCTLGFSQHGAAARLGLA